MDAAATGARLGGSTPERSWSTTRVPAHEQFAVWREVVGEAFVPVSLSRQSDGPFPSSVLTRTVGPCAVSRMYSQSQSVARTPAQIERRAGDVFFLNMPLSDGTSASQDCRIARLDPGDFVLVDSTRPFELRFRHHFQQISLALPHEMLSPLLASPAQATALRIPGDQGVGAVAAGAIKALAQTGGQFDRHAARAVTNHIAGLVALALGDLVSPPRSAARGLLLRAALDEVERSLDNPQLSPTHVAERLAISTRYLHSLFADQGESFGRCLLRRRLERCHEDLEDPTKAHWTIAQIALDRGFQDPSYFARAFRHRYSVNPTAHRQKPLRFTPAIARTADQHPIPGEC